MGVDEHKETDDVSGAARAAAEPVDEEDHPGDDRGAAEPEAEALSPPPPRIAELANASIRFVSARYGVELDFSPETLSFVDQWVRDARAEVGRRPEIADVVQSAAGAYLGEVIRRTFGGSWRISEDYADFRLCLSTVYCAFNPIGMVREALILDAADGWHGNFELDPGERDAAEQRLAALPHVEEDEFFAPSTRFDVVSILVEALRSAMEGQGLSDVRFGLEDYR
ncbi:MAG: DUF6278 family protein [Polyangiaceae bacterium]